MFDFLGIAGRCKKSQRFAAYIVGCVTLIVISVLLLVFADKWVASFEQCSEISINLLNLIEVNVIR